VKIELENLIVFNGSVYDISHLDIKFNRTLIPRNLDFFQLGSEPDLLIQENLFLNILRIIRRSTDALICFTICSTAS
jgi:hypothetical protein